MDQPGPGLNGSSNMTLTEFHTEAVKIAEEFPEMEIEAMSATATIISGLKFPTIQQYDIYAKTKEKSFCTKRTNNPTAALQLFRAELEKIRATNNIDNNKEDIQL